MLETITTKKARELRKKYPKFFGSEFDAKVRKKYALSGLANKKAQFIEHHGEDYMKLEEKALNEHVSQCPTNYLLIAQRYSREIKNLLSEKGDVAFVTTFFDWYDPSYMDDNTHPYMKGFMGRLLEAKKDFDVMKKDERNADLLYIMPGIDDIYTYIVECINKNSRPCKDYICNKLYDLAVLVLFDPEKNEKNMRHFLLNETVLKHYRFHIPNVSRNTKYAFKSFFSRGKNSWKQPIFIREIEGIIAHSAQFMLMYEESVYRKSKFEEDEVIKRVNERTSKIKNK